MKNIFKKILVVPVLLIAIVSAESKIFLAQIAEQTFSVTANFKKDESITPETAIELVLNRPLQPNEKIAVTIGETDLTSLVPIAFKPTFKEDSLERAFLKAICAQAEMLKSAA